MNDYSLTINNESVVLDDAQAIASTVDSIKKDMEELNNIVREKIPSLLDTDWAINWKENKWNTYYNVQFVEAMEEMLASANNLQVAVLNAMKNSKGE